MKRYNKIRNRFLEDMDCVAVLAILVLLSGIEGTEPMLFLKVISVPCAWLILRYMANY